MKQALGLLLAGFALLSASWVGANPPGQAPDEPSHYFKAIAAGRGDFRGEGFTPEPNAEPFVVMYRVLKVPREFHPQHWACNAFRGRESASCLLEPPEAQNVDRVLVPHGGFPPALYVVPGVVMRLASGPDGALLLGRTVFAVMCLGLLALTLAIALRRPGARFWLIGILLSLPPGVVFIATSMTASGPEVFAGLCLFVALFDIATGSDRRLSWAAAAASGVVLAVSRQISPGWVLGIGCAVAALVSPAGVWSSIRRHRVLAITVSVAVALAASWNMLWQINAGSVEPDRGSAFDKVVNLRQLWDFITWTVGDFGWLDNPMPLAGHVSWVLALSVLWIGALVVVGWRERLQLVTITAGLVLIVVLISAAVLWPTGIAPQSRHFLALAVVVPLTAAALLARHHESLRQRALDRALVVCCGVVAAVQLLGWLANAHRSAVGSHGPWWFVGEALWQPRGGWLPWFLVATGGSVLIAIGSIRVLNLERSTP